MVKAASATTVGKGGPSSQAISPRAPGGAVARRSGASKTPTKSKAPSNNAGTWRFYTEDSPGLKVGPVPVLVMSLLFIACVFMLHIWAKFTRG